MAHAKPDLLRFTSLMAIGLAYVFCDIDEMRWQSIQEWFLFYDQAPIPKKPARSINRNRENSIKMWIL